MSKKNKISDEQSYYVFKEEEYKYRTTFETLVGEISNHNYDIKRLKNGIYKKKKEIREYKKTLKEYQNVIKEFEIGLVFGKKLELSERYYTYLNNEAELHFNKYINEKNLSSFRTAKLYYQIIIDNHYFENEMVKNAKLKLTELNNSLEAEINK